MRRLLLLTLLCGFLPALASDSAPADEPVWRWGGTRAVPAPEAVQAASADAQFLYAISSTVIARYDRESGERAAVSRGPAQHLNSGFFHEGRLYCAHSNYPKIPEQSEVKVLDPETMTLTTLKNFGAFGGSLTWVVRHDSHWWCNFARYGADNGQTFLVRMDDDWREVGRWTYPPAVIKRLGRYSLSGGLWWNDELLVSGHDKGELFRLRLPSEGSVLELVAVQSTPFTGQGFARDPVTGGLIGISRSRKELVLAAPVGGRPLELRIMTYNIHHGEGIDGRLDLARIADIIRKANPDVVALQEVDQNVPRSGGVDQPAELARLTGLRAVFGGNIQLEGGRYGNAVLSRFPIVRSQNHPLPRLNDGEQRGVLEVECDLPGGHVPLLLWATHFDHRADHKERLASARAIAGWIARVPGRHAILAGDLNATPESPPIAAIIESWKQGDPGGGPTFPATAPDRKIDYILARPHGRWSPAETVVLDEAVASDHRAVLSVLQLLPE